MCLVKFTFWSLMVSRPPPAAVEFHHHHHQTFPIIHPEQPASGIDLDCSEGHPLAAPKVQVLVQGGGAPERTALIWTISPVNETSAGMSLPFQLAWGVGDQILV